MLDVKTSLLESTSHTSVILSVGAFFFDKNFDALYNIDSLGQFLYNYFLSCFLIAGIILLVALVGAIVLTLNFNSSRKNQLISRQLSRSIKCVHSFDI